MHPLLILFLFCYSAHLCCGLDRLACSTRCGELARPPASDRLFLFSKSVGCPWKVRPDLTENGGLISPEEQVGVVRDITRLVDAGDRAAAVALLKRQRGRWAALGMSGDQITQRFPWAVLEPGFPGRGESVGGFAPQTTSHK